MGALLALFWKKEERQPVKFGGGLLNAAKNNWRGLLSVLLLIIIMVMFFEPKKESPYNVIAIWLSMLAFMMVVPMAVGASALMPVYSVPMLGILKSGTVCGALANENITLFFLSGWLLLMLNNCGLHKRILCAVLAMGDVGSYTPVKLVLKSCMAAFCVSAIAERDLTTQAAMKYVIEAIEPVKSTKGEVNFEVLRNVLCNSIAISSLLGSMCIVYGSINTLQMRSLFCEAATASTELPDVFNFLNYSAYAIPTTLVMFLLNTGYEIVLVSQLLGKKSMSPYTKEQLQKAFSKNKQDLGPMSNHEKVSAGFLVLILLCFFTRWSKWLNMGWGTFRQYPTSPDLCSVKDATTAAIFVVLLHFLPKTLHFFKIFCVKKHGDLPKMQRESGILFWKFVDKNTDYSLFFLLGSGSIIYKAMVKTQLNVDIGYFCGKSITSLDWNVGILVVVLVSVVLSSIMSGLGAQACLMPLMLGIAMTGDQLWPQRQYLVALAVGLGTGFGFCSGFPHSPTYFVTRLGKVQRKKQIMYSIASQVICALILWLSLCFYAPLLWDPDDTGIFPQTVPGMETEAAAGAGGATTAATTAASAAP